MKKSLLFFLLFSFYGGMLQASKEWEQFLRAQKLFNEAKVSEALKEYEEITHKGPVVWFNIGNCLYKEGKKAEALAAWRAAEKGADTALLKKIYPQMVRVMEELGIEHDIEWHATLSLLTSYFPLFITQVLFLLLWLLLWLHAFNRIVIPGRYVYGVVVLTILGGGIIASKWWLAQKRHGVVTSEQLEVFAGPDKEFHKQGEWEYGQQFLIDQERDGWYKVKHKNMTGWVHSSDVKYQD